MEDNASQKMDSTRVNHLVQDFLQFLMKAQTMLPQELTQLQKQLDELYPKHQPAVKYDLFYRISRNLYRKSSMTMGELSNALLIPISTATGMVDLLVNSGYAQRVSDPEDRRVVRVALTDSGRELHQTIENHLGQQIQRILSYLTEKEQNTFLAIIPKMLSALR